MPLWMFLLTFASALVLSWLLNGLMLHALARALGARHPLRRAVVAGCLFALAVLPLISISVLSARDSPLQLLGCSPPLLGLLTLKLYSKFTWPRTLALTAISLPLMTAAGLALGITMRVFLCEAFVIPTGAMIPTLLPGDRFLTDKTLPLRRWDLVAYRNPADPTSVFVQRVVGLPGETVEIDSGGAVHINNQPIAPGDGPGVHYSTRPLGFRSPCHGCTGTPMTLGKDEYYMLGDNTDISKDSRYLGSNWPPGVTPGAIPASHIVGVARFVYAPVSRWRAFR